MQGEKDLIEKMRKIVEVLPRSNCGECGFENCGKFARALAEGKASPFGCRQDPSVGYVISEILGMKIPEEAKIQAGYPRFPQPVIPSGGMSGGRGMGHHHHQGFGRGMGHHHHRGRGRGRERC